MRLLAIALAAALWIAVEVGAVALGWQISRQPGSWLETRADLTLKATPPQGGPCTSTSVQCAGRSKTQDSVGFHRQPDQVGRHGKLRPAPFQVLRRDPTGLGTTLSDVQADALLCAPC